MYFEMNEKLYETDKETFDVLDSIIPSAKEKNDFSAVGAVMTLGLEQGRIREIRISKCDATNKYQKEGI